MSKITPKYKVGDMFSMEPNSRLIICSLCGTSQFYRIASVVSDKILSSPDYEVWTMDKVHDLVNRGKIKFLYNIFSIIVLPFTFIHADSPESTKV